MSNKGKIILSVIGVIFAIALLCISAVLAENEVIGPVSAAVLTAVSFVITFVAVFYAAKVDYETGVYECRKCGNVFKPTFKAYILGCHTLTTRHLKCPECEKRSWCKRKLI